MKLSTKGRYGLKAMVDLATEYDSGARLSIAQLAERQGVSAAYLEQLIASLKKAGLVTALRGVQGGYVLAVRRSLSASARCLEFLKAARQLSIASAQPERIAATSVPAPHARFG